MTIQDVSALIVFTLVLVLSAFSYRYIKEFHKRSESYKSERIGLIIYLIAIVSIISSTPFFCIDILDTWGDNIYDIFFDTDNRTGTFFFWLSVCVCAVGFVSVSGRLQRIIDWVNQGK